MEYTKKFLYQSNQWYNDGLKKANIHDLSGAITSLKKSLQYNRSNIAARNLLGLVYYGRGEVVEALVEWIISKNMKSHENIADYYIRKVEETPSELDAINQSIRKFNQCLTYCQQGGEDLAIIQLKKVVATFPSFLKAHQLLALLYMHTEQYAKARQALRKAHRLDTTNDITLRYMHELTQLHSKKVSSLREQKDQSVSYSLGNETIIQPVSSTLKDNAALLTILNIAIGIALGAAVVWFLVVPAVGQNKSSKVNQEVIAYSDQLAAKESEISTLKKEVADYQTNLETVEAEKQKAQGTQAGYEALVNATIHYYTKNYDRAALVDELIAVNKESLGEGGLTHYNAMVEDVFAEQCAKLYPRARNSYRVKNYGTAIEALEQVIKMNEGYENGEALLLLGKAYKDSGDTEKANEKLNRVIELFPDSKPAQEAAEVMQPVEEGAADNQ